MRITDRAESAAQAIFAALQVEADERQAATVKNLLQKTIVNAMLEEAERCSNAAVECCSPDLDTAHKVTEEIERRNQALLANLSSMR